MPARYIRESLLDSETVAKADDAAAMLFVRLMLVADDFGRFDGRIEVIMRKCWPLGDSIKGFPSPKAEDVLERLVRLTEIGLVVAYEVDGKPFIRIPKFKQRTRAQGSKYPDPPPNSKANDGQTPVIRQTDAGQTSGTWRAADGPPRAVSRSVSVSYSSTRAHEETSTSKQKAPAIDPIKAPAAMTPEEREAHGITPPPQSFMDNLPNNLKRAIEKRQQPQEPEGGDNSEIPW